MMERTLFQEEHSLLRSTFCEYIKKSILPDYPKWEKEGQVPREMWLDAGNQGWLCPTAKQEYGGLGAELLHSVVIAEELSYQGTPGFFISLHNDIVFPYLEQFANESQLRYWVPGCISGKTVLALAMTEPGHGSDLGRIETRAVLKNGEYVINGSKIFISNGQLADLFIVAVRTSSPERPHDGISLLLVPSDSPGFARGRNLEKIGLHVQDTSEIFFDDCRVPEENLL
jgi:acyl-CoA dehydrogenase